MYWLIREDIGRDLNALREVHKPTAEERSAHRDTVAAKGEPDCLTVAGNVAEIRVEGILTARPDFWAWLFGDGNTTYCDLLDAIAEVRTNPAVTTVHVLVDSPGGQADGLFDVIAAFQDLRAAKDVKVRAASAHSAAYGIAAAAGRIEAAGDAAMFGSVGVATHATFYEGVDVVHLTNTESPDKRPDVRTDEGRAVVVRELDAIYGLFAEAIGEGRGMDPDKVAETTGRGASFVARDALSRGMIDSIAGYGESVPAPTPAARAATKMSATRRTETRMSTDTSPIDAPTAAEDEEDEEPAEAAETAETVETAEEPTEPEAADAAEEDEDEEDDMPPGDDDEEDDEEEDAAKTAIRLAADEKRRTRLARRILGRKDATVDDALLALAEAKNGEWLDSECAKRSVTLSSELRDRLVKLCGKTSDGRDIALDVVQSYNAPPQGDPMDGAAEARITAESLTDAIAAYMDEARELLLAEEAKRADKQGRKPNELGEHFVYARAEQLARERHPELCAD